MKIARLILTGFAGSLLLCAPASGGITSTEALVVDISDEVGTPSDLTTYAVYVQFTDPADVLLSHTLWDVSTIDATFYHASPITDDPLHLISDSVTTHPFPGSTPISISPEIVERFPAYQVWAWDTHLSMDGSLTQSSPEALMQLTATHIGPRAGCFNPNPAIPVTAGADLQIEIAKLTVTAGGGISGTFFALLPPPAGEDAFPVMMTIDIPPNTPCPSDLDGDGTVNGIDIAILLANWSIPPGTPGCHGELPCPMDFSGDGLVNGIDLGILLSHWGLCE